MLIEVKNDGNQATVTMSDEVKAGLDLLIESDAGLAPGDYLAAIQHMLVEQGWLEEEDDDDDDDDDDEEEDDDDEDNSSGSATL